MLKIFIRNDKFNAIDDNNVFAGFDLASRCCENFNWKLVGDGINVEFGGETKIDLDFPDLVFDTKFFEELEDGVKFRLTNMITGAELFLTFSNVHEGYYSHGFHFIAVDENLIKKGWI